MFLWTWKSSSGLLAPAQIILFSRQVPCSHEQYSLSQQPFTSRQHFFPLTQENKQGLCGESTGVFLPHSGCMFSVVEHKNWLKQWDILYVSLYKLHYTKMSLHLFQKAGHYCSLKTERPPHKKIQNHNIKNLWKKTKGFLCFPVHLWKMERQSFHITPTKACYKIPLCLPQLEAPRFVLLV